MKLKTIIALVAIAALSGCATLDQIGAAANCTESNFARLKADNDYLLERKKVIDGYADGSIPVPGMVFSFASKAEIVEAHKASYNRIYDRLVYHSDLYNRLCAGRPPVTAQK